MQQKELSEAGRCEEKVIGHMGHCGEGVRDHYQLVEGEVEGVF